VPYWCPFEGENRGILIKPHKFQNHRKGAENIDKYIKMNFDKNPAIRAHNLKVGGSNPPPATNLSS